MLINNIINYIIVIFNRITTKNPSNQIYENHFFVHYLINCNK